MEALNGLLFVIDPYNVEEWICHTFNILEERRGELGVRVAWGIIERGRKIGKKVCGRM